LHFHLHEIEIDTWEKRLTPAISVHVYCAYTMGSGEQIARNLSQSQH
jgi:hypothetical protein